jgi:hypothetical protein
LDPSIRSVSRIAVVLANFSSIFQLLSFPVVCSDVISQAEMKLLRPLAGYTLHDHKTKDYIRRELQIPGILDKIDEYGRNWLLQLQRTDII